MNQLLSPFSFLIIFYSISWQSHFFLTGYISWLVAISGLPKIHSVCAFSHFLTWFYEKILFRREDSSYMPFYNLYWQNSCLPSLLVFSLEIKEKSMYRVKNWLSLRQNQTQDCPFGGARLLVPQNTLLFQATQVKRELGAFLHIKYLQALVITEAMNKKKEVIYTWTSAPFNV